MSHIVYCISHLCNQHNYDVPAVSCTPKQIDLQAILLLQLPHCVRVLLLIRGCKSAAAQYKFRYYYLASPVELRPFKTYTEIRKQSASARKVGMAHAF